MRARVFSIGAALLAASAGGAAGQTATQLVRIQVNAVNQIGVSGAPEPLVINNATAGQGPASVTASGGRWAVTTNEENQKVTASLDQPLPDGISLQVTLQPPAGATASGEVVLGTAASDVVTGMNRLAASALSITYRLTATATATTTTTTRTVTFTIVSGT